MFITEVENTSLLKKLFWSLVREMLSRSALMEIYFVDLEISTVCYACKNKHRSYAYSAVE